MKNRLIIAVQLLVIVMILTGGYIWTHRLPNSMMVFHPASEYPEEYTAEDRNSPVEIRSKEDWYQFAESVNGGQSYDGRVISLQTDLDFGDGRLIPVGSRQRPFEGIFCGNGFTLRNLVIVSDAEYVGVFGYVQDGMIDSLHLENCRIDSESARATGGIAGYFTGGAIRGCSFDGQISASDGSLGGIVGSNRSRIESCVVRGSVAGTTTTSHYGSGDQWITCGTGGIAGENLDVISNCRNYAAVYVGKSIEAEKSSTYGAGGMAGSHYGEILSCVNFGSVYGGGIAYRNDSGSSIRDCFNLADTYAGGVVHATSSSYISQCVNLGQTSGRYAGDIVSFWDEAEAYYETGSLEGCLYTNTSGVGAANRDDGDRSIRWENYRIGRLSAADTERLYGHLESEDIDGAFQFLLRTESVRRGMAVGTLALLTAAVFLLSDGIIILRPEVDRRKKYRQAEICVRAGAYREAAGWFAGAAAYKDSAVRSRQCLIKYLNLCRSGGIYELGRMEGKAIPWIKIGEADGCDVLLSQYALLSECIDAGMDPVSWEHSALYRRLNNDYRMAWFDEIERSILAGELSILTEEDAQSIFKTSEERKCRAFIYLNKVLQRSGNVFWWVRPSVSQRVHNMPFVTPDGFISKIGKTVTADNIAVRPVIMVRIRDENH